MSSVGFGDIKPQTTSETMAGLIVMLIGVLTYATTTAFVASFAAHANPPAEAFQEKSAPSQALLKKTNASQNLREKTRNYFDALWKTLKGTTPEEAFAVW